MTRRRHGGRGNIERCLRQVARVPCSAAAGPDGVRRRGMLAHGAALTGRGAALMLAAARRWRRSRRRYRLGSRSGSWSLWSGQQLGSAGLLTQAWRGRQLLLEGSGAAGGGIGSKPELEPEPRSAAGADCPVARRAHAAGGSVRTDCPTHIGTAWTPAAVRRRRRCDQTPAWVWPSRWRRHRLGAEAGFLFSDIATAGLYTRWCTTRRPKRTTCSSLSFDPQSETCQDCLVQFEDSG